MLLNVPDASLLVAQPLGRVVPTQFLDEFFGATRDVPRKVDGVDTLQEKKPLLFGNADYEDRPWLHNSRLLKHDDSHTCET